MRTLLLFCLVLLSLPSFSQESESKWNLHATVSPQVCYRYQGNESGYIGLNGERPKGKSIFGYAAALGISRQLSANWQVEIGLSINQCGFGESIKYEPLKVNDPTDPVYTSLSPKEGKITSRFLYESVPVRVNGAFGHGRLRPVFTGGLVFGRLINANENKEITMLDGTVKTYEIDVTESYHDYSLFLELGFGVEYKLTPKIGLRAIPFGSFGIMKLDKQEYNYHLFQGGLRVGVFYRF